MSDQSTDGFSDAKERATAERKRAWAKSYRERNAERRRDYAKAYRERNPERIREYRMRYREEHRESELSSKREYSRRRTNEARRAKERAERRRVYGRSYYAEHREQIADSARRARARQKTANPEKYLAQRRMSTKRWRDKNKDRENAKLRARYEQNAAELRAHARAYYYANRERILAQRKAARDAAPDVIRSRQRRYRAAERRRREVGLPPYRRHRSRPAERAQHQADADQFFAKTLDPVRIRANRNGPTTPPELIARWERDSARQRAAHFRATHAGTHGMHRATEVQRARCRMEDERDELRCTAEQAAEDDRLDAIARRVNEQLRRERRPFPRVDAAASDVIGGVASTRGLSR